MKILFIHEREELGALISFFLEITVDCMSLYSIQRNKLIDKKSYTLAIVQGSALHYVKDKEMPPIVIITGGNIADYAPIAKELKCIGAVHVNVLEHPESARKALMPFLNLDVACPN